MATQNGDESDSYDECEVQLERFPRASERSHTPATRTFHSFSRLPAELRARVWAMALHNQIKYVGSKHVGSKHVGRNKIDVPNEIHVHEEKGTITAQAIRGYPMLFFVNREARYEAAKIDGGTWYALKPGVEIYANLDKEKVFVFSCYQGPGLELAIRRFNGGNKLDCNGRGVHPLMHVHV